jgi:hypothetical protein
MYPTLLGAGAVSTCIMRLSAVTIDSSHDPTMRLASTHARLAKDQKNYLWESLSWAGKLWRTGFVPIRGIVGVLCNRKAHGGYSCLRKR